MMKLAALVSIVLCAAVSAADAPNVVFIMVDDLGYADLGCYGQKHIRTPNIDALAARGTRFTDCYSGSTVCAPARSVLMTGMHTGHTTVRGNFGKGGVRGLGGGEGRVPLAAKDLTVAEVLREAGYVTGAVGKWGLGEPNTSGEPNEQGFDEWFGYLNQRRAHSFYVDYVWLNKERYPLPGNRDGRRTQYTHDWMTAFALDFVRRHAREKFFLYIPYTIPHANFEVPSLGEYADKPWTKDEKSYAAMVSRMDRDIGRLSSLLDELKLSSNTLVFFCSDNGAAKRWDGRFDSSGPLRGRKRDMYEGGIRVPMIVAGPHVPAGRTSEAVWYFADVLPTLAQIAGAKVPEGIDGVSVAASLFGRTQESLTKRTLYWEFFGRGFKQAARRGSWKAIKSKPGQGLELYDLTHDLGETQDRAKERPQLVLEFEELFRSSRRPSANWPSPIDSKTP